MSERNRYKAQVEVTFRALDAVVAVAEPLHKKHLFHVRQRLQQILNTDEHALLISANEQADEKLFEEKGTVAMAELAELQLMTKGNRVVQRIDDTAEQLSIALGRTRFEDQEFEAEDEIGKRRYTVISGNKRRYIDYP